MKISSFLCDTRRFGVGSNRLLPVTEPGENVRRHVLRVCRGRRHLGVAARRREPLLGERRRIVEVYQIMSYARMLRLTRPDFFQDCGPLELIGISLVGG